MVDELTPPKYDSLHLKVHRVDINNDGVDELIFSSDVFLTTSSNSDGVDSGLWVFQCKNGFYQISYKKELLGEYEGNPRLVAAGRFK